MHLHVSHVHPVHSLMALPKSISYITRHCHVRRESPSSTSATTTSINESVLAALQSLAQQDSTAMGPASLGSWLVFWTRRSAYAFHFRYLIEWGGRCVPLPCVDSHMVLPTPQP